MSESRRRGLWLLGVLVIACVIAVAAVWRFRKAKVTGDTAEQRIASVIRIADDRPRGYAKALADTAGNDPDAGVRSKAVDCLHGNLAPDASSAVTEATRDDDPQVRKSACISLMACDDEATVKRLAEICHEDTDADVRDAAFVALAANESPHATVALMAMMEGGDTSEMRLAAAWGMIDKANMSLEPTPKDSHKWGDMIEGLKLSSGVQAAFEETNTPLLHDEAARKRIYESVMSEQGNGHHDHDHDVHADPQTSGGDLEHPPAPGTH